MLLYERLELFNELYFGKSKISDVKKAFDKYYELIGKDDGRNIYANSEYTNMCKAFEKFFGVESFRLQLFVDQDINAYTYFIMPRIKKKSPLNEYPTDIYILTKEGIKINNVFRFSMSVAISKAAMIRLTSDQAFAIILHEIGHNFAYVPLLGFAVTSAKVASEVKRSTPDINKDIFDANEDNKEETISFINKWVRNSPTIKHMIDAYKKCKVSNGPTKDNGFVTSLTYLVASYMTFIRTPVNLLFNLVTGLPRRKEVKLYSSGWEEILADSFASTYGYGPDLQSTLTGNMSMDDTFMKYMYAMIAIPNTVLSASSHPTVITRCKASITHLKQELANNKMMTEAERKEATENLKDVEELLASYMNSGKGLYRADRGSRIVALIVNKIFGGKIDSDLNKTDFNFGMSFDGYKGEPYKL